MLELVYVCFYTAIKAIRKKHPTVEIQLLFFYPFGWYTDKNIQTLKFNCVFFLVGSQRLGALHLLPTVYTQSMRNVMCECISIL